MLISSSVLCFDYAPILLKYQVQSSEGATTKMGDIVTQNNNRY